MVLIFFITLWQRLADNVIKCAAHRISIKTYILLSRKRLTDPTKRTCIAIVFLVFDRILHIHVVVYILGNHYLLYLEKHICKAIFTDYNLKEIISPEISI